MKNWQVFDKIGQKVIFPKNRDSKGKILPFELLIFVLFSWYLKKIWYFFAKIGQNGHNLVKIQGSKGKSYPLKLNSYVCG